MGNGNIPTWENWIDLEPEVQEYEKHRILLDIERRLHALESKKWKNAAIQLFGSIIGGAAIIMTYMYFFKSAIEATAGG